MRIYLFDMIQTPKINLIHGDCMELMRETPDGFYDLAIVDVNYGIQQDGRNNHTRGKLAKSRDYRERSRYDDESPAAEYQKIRSFGVPIILSAKFLLIRLAGLCGIKTTGQRILRTVNSHGHLLIVLFGRLNLSGKACFRAI